MEKEIPDINFCNEKKIKNKILDVEIHK